MIQAGAAVADAYGEVGSGNSEANVCDTEGGECDNKLPRNKRRRLAADTVDGRGCVPSCQLTDEKQLAIIDELVAKQRAQIQSNRPEQNSGDEVGTGVQSNCGNWVRNPGSACWQRNPKARLSKKILRAAELERSRDIGGESRRHRFWRCKCGRIGRESCDEGMTISNLCGRDDCARFWEQTRPCAVCGNLTFCDGRLRICHWLGVTEEGRRPFWINAIQYAPFQASRLRMSTDDQRRSCPLHGVVCGEALMVRGRRRFSCPSCSACLPVHEFVLASSFRHPWVMRAEWGGVGRLIMIHLDRKTLGAVLLTKKCQSTYDKLDLAVACLAGGPWADGCVGGILTESWQESFLRLRYTYHECNMAWVQLAVQLGRMA